jgi:hypothetical protein
MIHLPHRVIVKVQAESSVPPRPGTEYVLPERGWDNDVMVMMSLVD